MKEEWQDISFETISHRDSGTYVLASVDEIQTLLDDHIVKTQAMRGSPFAKPFESEIKVLLLSFFFFYSIFFYSSYKDSILLNFYEVLFFFTFFFQNSTLNNLSLLL